MERFISLKDKGRNYLDTLTGQTVSKRQRDKLLRGNISNEMAAKMNRITNPEIAYSRPARGRKSLLKATQTEREFIVSARIEAEQLRREQVKKEREERAQYRKLQKQLNKKVKPRKITTQMLTKGRMGVRVPFNTYEEYVTMKNEAKATGKVVAYGLGMRGFHANTGQELDITVFTMMLVNNKLIPKDEFEETFQEEIESRSYFVFQHYWMHVAFKVEYARARREKYLARKKAKEDYKRA